MSELRLLTYNVRSLREDREAVAAVVRACRPDVVTIQEAPRTLRWRSKRAALARMSGLVVATADRPGGLMVMTSLAVSVRSTSFALLPKTPDLHQRAVCIADVSLRGVDWRIVSTHLSLDADERRRHLPSLWSAIDPAGPAASGVNSALLVVGADVNEDPGGPVWASLTERLQDAFADNSGRVDREGLTFSTRNRRRRIDGIFVDRRVEVVECRVVTDVPDAATVRAASDHYPLLAVLRSAGGRRPL
ncbi:MAG TPA: endonuclease/exonuclease/phosphatase family protein [Mycobacteriales bacterium]|nr:endonuclease/exonuclease/phosphatase family protein [Mycobacteriales bacterium]